MELTYDRGTILLGGAPPEARALPHVLWDARVGALRAPGHAWSIVRRALESRALAFADSVRPELPALAPFAPPDLRPYQAAALSAWEAAGRRGIIALPTGAGKTRTAVAAVATAGVRALCLAPTRVLVAQWRQAFLAGGLAEVGQFGDGVIAERPVTVATYASALRRAESLGNRFDLVVVDEAHHFGGANGDEVLELSIAPWRLGLTATPAVDPGRVARLERLIGSIVYRATIEELSGRWLAPFDLLTLSLDLTPEERAQYDAEANVFSPVCRSFFRQAAGAAWMDFVAAANRTSEGRRALTAWRRSRAIVGYTRAKAAVLASLLEQHGAGRVLVFAPDNETAYEVARAHLVQPVTCDIGREERASALASFAAGALRVLVSARVLGEGLDVPAADVAIVLGGRNGARQFVQRVGRVLRPAVGKRAVVYQLVARGTHEVRLASARRRSLGSG